MKFKVDLRTLREMQGWSLSKKIDHSLLTLENFRILFPKYFVSYFGGLDSTVLLHLSRILDKERSGIFVNTTNEYTDIIKFAHQTENIKIISPEVTFEQVVNTHGFPLISKRISHLIHICKHTENPKVREKCLKLIPEKYRFLINAPFDITDYCCYHLKKKPLHQYMERGTAVGTLASDSRLREFMFLQTGCINIPGKQVTPLSIWTHQDIIQYIQDNHLPYCTMYNEGYEHTGCAYCGFGLAFVADRFSRNHKQEPHRFKKMMQITNNGITYEEVLRKYLKVNLDTFLPNLFNQLL